MPKIPKGQKLADMIEKKANFQRGKERAAYLDGIMDALSVVEVAAPRALKNRVVSYLRDSLEIEHSKLSQ